MESDHFQQSAHYLSFKMFVSAENMPLCQCFSVLHVLSCDLTSHDHYVHCCLFLKEESPYGLVERQRRGKLNIWFEHSAHSNPNPNLVVFRLKSAIYNGFYL